MLRKITIALAAASLLGAAAIPTDALAFGRGGGGGGGGHGGFGGGGMHFGGGGGGGMRFGGGGFGGRGFGPGFRRAKASSTRSRISQGVLSQAGLR